MGCTCDYSEKLTYPWYGKSWKASGRKIEKHIEKCYEDVFSGRGK
jgi:hypothetical protein